MYFYARVIAPTVYFYPTRVICNEFSLSLSLSLTRSLARSLARSLGAGTEDTAIGDAAREKRWVHSRVARAARKARRAHLRVPSSLYLIEYVTIAHEINTMTSKERTAEYWITVAFLASSRIRNGAFFVLRILLDPLSRTRKVIRERVERTRSVTKLKLRVKQRDCF